MIRIRNHRGKIITRRYLISKRTTPICNTLSRRTTFIVMLLEEVLVVSQSDSPISKVEENKEEKEGISKV